MKKQKKLMYTLMKVFLISMITMCFLIIAISFIVTTQTIDTKEKVATYALIDRVDNELYIYINYMQELSNIIINDHDISTFLDGDQNDKVLKQRIHTQLYNSVKNKSDISTVIILDNNGDFVSNRNNITINPYSDYKNSSWYTNAIMQPENYHISSSYVQNLIYNEYVWIISLSRAIVINNKVVGVLLIDLNYDVITSVCKSTSLDDKGYIYIVDNKGYIVYHPYAQLVYSNIKPEPLNFSEANYNGFSIDNKQYYISNKNKLDWQTVCVIYKDKLLKEKLMLIPYYIIIALIFALVIILLSYLISKKITKPISQLQIAMKEVEAGNFDIKAEVDADNEIKELSNNFNIMTAQIKLLIEQNKKDLEQRRISELKVLYAQIKPHFLYNTLESIIWLAENSGQKDIVNITSSLAKLFRTSISITDELVPLQMEIDNVTSYLTIQKIRYKNKLNFEIDLEDGIEQYKVVRLMLQPLVENSIYHGIKPKKGNGTIYIRGWQDIEQFYILIEDDGVGMTSKQLSDILNDDKDKSGIGSKNVNTRIKLCFGKEYGIIYTSSENQGTKAIINLPILL